MKKTKWADRVFTEEEKGAQRQWQAADQHLMELFSALELCPNFDPDGFDGDAREQLHDRLDQHLDDIAMLVNRAKAVFPDIEESFTIATGTIKL